LQALGQPPLSQWALLWLLAVLWLEIHSGQRAQLRLWAPLQPQALVRTQALLPELMLMRPVAPLQP